MALAFARNYSQLSDKEVVEQVINLPYNDEAAAYIIYDRYNPLLFKIYRKVFDDNLSWYEDCQGDLFDYLKGKELDWRRLRSFEWRCHFAAWIGRTANNRFLEIKPYLIGKISGSISIDDDDNENHNVQLPDEGVENYEALERKIIVLEAISQLNDLDQKFVILKRLQGFNSTEIAELLKRAWKKHNIKKYDNKGNLVTPTASYVDVKTLRAKENLKEIIVKHYNV